MGITDVKTRNRILFLLFFGVLMGALDIAIVGPALPAIKDSFPGVTDRSIAWIFSIYVLFNLIGTPLMAKLSDLFGRKTVYIADVAIFAVGSLVVALAPQFGFILLGRAIQGLGAGGIFPVASAVIGDTFPPEKRGSALGLIGAVFGLAFIVGPILGGVLLLAGWHWLFIINLPIALVLIIMSIRILPSSQFNQKVTFDWAGMAVLASLLALLAFGINQIDTANFFSSLVNPGVYPYILAAFLLVPVFLIIESRSTNPIIRLNLFKNRQMVIAYLLSAGAGFGESGLVFMPTLALAAEMVKSKSSASFLLMPVVLAMSVGSPMAGRFLDKFGSKAVILSGTFILTAGFVLLGVSSTSLTWFILAGVLIGLGLSALLGAPIRYIMLNEAATQDRSVAQGVASLFSSIGQLFGASIIGAVTASGNGSVAGYDNAYLLTGAVTLLLLFLTFALKSRNQEFMSARKNDPSIQPEVTYNSN